jgi:hypothetical protein
MTTVEKSGFAWRRREITRLEQFSDAVFAFALAPLGALFGGPWAFGLHEGGRLLAIYSAGFIAVLLLFALLYRHALADADALALLGPPWMTPVAGMMYSLIGVVMRWHWGRFFRRWKVAE